MVRVGLIGVGNMGKKYAQMIISGRVPNMKLTAVVIRRDELLEWGKGLVNIDGEQTQIFRTSDEMFASPDTYDAVLIVTPHKTHKVLAIKAMELGKDVMCDKPSAATLTEALAMNQCAMENHRIFGIMFHQRLYPKYQKIKSLIETGEIGDIKRIMMVNSRYLRTSRYHNMAEWRSSWKGEGGGALINQGQHILDIWAWLFGMPETIYAKVPFGKYNDFDVDDEATIVMGYKNGASGVFMLSTGEAHHEERLEIVGTKGKILLEDDTMHIYRYEDIVSYIKNADVNSREKIDITEEIINFEKSEEPYVQMLENFAECVIRRDAKGLIAKGNEGTNALMLMCASYYSEIKGKIVNLPLDASSYDECINEYIN